MSEVTLYLIDTRCGVTGCDLLDTAMITVSLVDRLPPCLTRHRPRREQARVAVHVRGSYHLLIPKPQPLKP